MKKTNLLFITGLVSLTVGLASCNPSSSVAVESIAISGPNEVVEGESITLTATVSPDNASDKTVTWSSDNTEYATVSDAGVVSALKAGTVNIKATAKNGVFGSYQVTVKAKVIPVSSVTISGPTEVLMGETITLSAAVAPDNATVKDVTWSSENPEFATVANGVVTPVAPGEATIKATANNGVSGSYTVTVRPINVSTVIISGPTTVEKGQNINLSARVTPDNATVKTVTWSSENPTIASVNNEGVVSALAKGVATIKATANNGVSGSYDITVTEHFAINYPTGTDMIFEGPISAEEGEFVSFSIVTNTALASVTANGKECGKDNNGYFFYMPAEAVTIAVTEASVIPHTVKYAINNKSKVVSIVGPNEAEAGETVSLSLAVNPGYQLKGVTIYSNINAFDPEDRVVVDSTFANGVVEFTMPAEPVDIEIEVSVNSYKLDFVSDNADALGQVNNVYDGDGRIIRTVEGNTRHVPYGTRVKVTLNNTSSYYTKKVAAYGLSIDGVEYTCEEGSSDVYFTMPYHAVKATVLYDFNYRTFSLTNSDNITLAAYKLVNGEYVEMTELKAVYEDTIYLKATIAEGSGVEVKDVTAVYKNGAYNYDVKVTVSGPNADGYYSFVMPDTTNEVRVTVTEVNPNKFAGKDFVGDFVGFNLYGGKPYTEPSLSRSLSIAASGVMKIGTSEYEIASADEENGVLTTTDDYLLGYAGNFIFSKYSLSATNVITNDNNIYYKLGAGETKDTYKFYAVQTSDKVYNIIQVYKDGVCVDGIFLHGIAADFTTYAVYTGVKFAFTTGTKVSDIGAVAFEVRAADDTYICEFSGTNASNKADLTYSVSDGLKGTYTNAEKGDLVLDGVGGASLAGEAGYSYVAGENNTYIVSRETNTSKDTYVITLGEGTYTVDSEEHETLVSSIFRGFTFTGTHLDYWGDSEAVQVVFDDKAGDITGKIVIGGAYSHHDFGFTAVYDESSHTLTLTIVSELYNEGFVDQVLTASVAEGAITFTSTFTGSNAQTYNILNSVCSNANFHIL